MSVPKYYEFFEGVLRSLEDGNIHSANDIRISLAKTMGLSEKDLSEMQPSGKQTIFSNRVGWAKTYLSKAGLLVTPQRGNYKITNEGLQALRSGKEINIAFLEQYESFRLFRNATSDKTTDVQDEDCVESPMESLEYAFDKINSSLASDLMDEVMKLAPFVFEKLVVVLLLRMGYGNGIEKSGVVTQQSKDGGIDGIVKEDQLGFSNIYIQAKQWAPNQTVSKPEIQKFVGALQGVQAQKGLFITTAKFSKGAIEYANNLLGAKIVLIDGEALTKLMIKHNVGVAIEQVFEVKKIDGDFFLDEL